MKISLLAFITLLIAPLAMAANSSFNEVRNVLFSQSVTPQNQQEAAEMAVYQKGELPHYKVTAASFIENGINKLVEAAKRTIGQKDDYYPRLTKLLHPNGVCATGEWRITEKTPYTGYFQTAARGLFIGRWSVALSDTLRGQDRGFGFAGKIFPTTNPDLKVETASFFTVDVLMGTQTNSPLLTATTNEPDLGFNFSLISLGLKIANALQQADASPLFRPLYPISELDSQDPSKAKTPHWMMLKPRFSDKLPVGPDFRDELQMRNFPKGLAMEIYVSDTTKDRTKLKGCTKIGEIALRYTVVSYGCDRQLHFGHPKLR